jgi:hypothetical protein
MHIGCKYKELNLKFHNDKPSAYQWTTLSQP